MKHNFDIFSKIRGEVDSFENDEISLIDPSTKELRLDNDTQHLFSQKKTLNLIDMYYNSKFESGKYDSEGQRKVFLNISKFRADVAAKQTDVDISNFLFIPETDDDFWKVWLMQKQFGVWSEEKEYGFVINELNRDFSKYGSCVMKRVDDAIHRVPLRSLKNTQDAKSLKEAALGGGYVIEHHRMTFHQISQMEAWNTDDLEDSDDKIDVFERYGLVPVAFLKELNGEEVEDADYKEHVLAVTVVVPDKKSGKQSKDTGIILFAEELDEEDFPYDEAHWDKQDGRWLGIGEVENQFENQVARNMTANLRRRNLLWASKKIFQSQATDAVAKNLVKDVKDGEVLEVGPGGQITQIDQSTRALADFSQDEAVWDRNSDQKSFTFEVNTGESLPSGTPFRLGVLLSSAASSHFAQKQETFAMMLRRSFFKLIVPIFQETVGEHVVMITNSDAGVDRLRKFIREQTTSEMIKESVFTTGRVPDRAEIETKVDRRLLDIDEFFINVPKKFYKNSRHFMKLVISGENVDVNKQIETLTTVYQLLAQRGDPRAEKLLSTIVSKTGILLPSVLGDMPTEQNIQSQALNPGQTAGIEASTSQNAQAQLSAQ